MFYSDHDLCDQIKPDNFTFVIQLIPFFFIPIPDTLQSIRIIRQKSTHGISPTSTLLRYLFCTAHLSNALTLPYMFAAAECCQKRGMSTATCMVTMLVVIQASAVWFCNGVSTAVFLLYYKDPKPRLLSSATGIIRLSAPLSENELWTPGRRFVLSVCFISSAFLIPISVFYIAPVFPPTGEAYWFTLEAWSFGLNISAVTLAIIQGLPQLRLSGRMAFERLNRLAEGLEDIDKPTTIEMAYLISSVVRWLILAGVWTTWFGVRLYANIKFYPPVMWIVGAEVYWNYLIMAVVDGMTAWLIWSTEVSAKKEAKGKRVLIRDGSIIDGRASSASSSSVSRRPDNGHRDNAPTERAPLLGGIRWHETGGNQYLT